MGSSNGVSHLRRCQGSSRRDSQYCTNREFRQQQRHVALFVTIVIFDLEIDLAIRQIEARYHHPTRTIVCLAWLFRHAATSMPRQRPCCRSKLRSFRRTSMHAYKTTETLERTIYRRLLLLILPRYAPRYTPRLPSTRSRTLSLSNAKSDLSNCIHVFQKVHGRRGSASKVLGDALHVLKASSAKPTLKAKMPSYVFCIMDLTRSGFIPMVDC